MKHVFLLVLTMVLSLTAGLAQIPLGYGCGTDEHELLMQQQYPQEHARRMELEKKVQELVASGAAQRLSKTLLVIPLVVHIITDNAIGTSKAQIEDGIAVLNRDFRRLNADTVNTRPLFRPFAADLEIEFRLAKIDPNGNCTDGIVRVSSPLTNSANPVNLVKAVSYWPSDRYLNVWMVNSIYGLAANGVPLGGLAQLPGSGPVNTFGFLIKPNFWGTIGSANSRDGRLVTHEMGHCMNLLHTFGGGCGSSCQYSGDLVCDTPPTASPTSAVNCNNTLNSCPNDNQGLSPFSSNVVDQTENYLSYDFCQNLFTIGQKDRVMASFATYSFLQNLTSQANLIATGTNDGYVAAPCAPVASFYPQPGRVCAGSAVNFYDDSYNATVDSSWSWNWSFPGGTPAVSTLQNPVVTYANPGTYSATLVVINPQGSDTLTRTAIVKVIPVTGGEVAPFSEGFENPGFPASGLNTAKDWEIINTSANGWARSTAAAFQGIASLRINNFAVTAGARNSLQSPTIDMSNLQTVKVEFDLAYALRTATTTDRLYIYTSTNCGQSWQLKYTKTGTQLSTNNGVVQPNFIPASPGQWRHEIVNLTGISGQSNVLVKLEVESNTGNNLFIDNFQITGTVLSAAELLNGQPVAVFPNPVTSEAILSFFLPAASKAIVQVQDVLGRTLASNSYPGLGAGEQQLSIDELLHPLPAGLYLLQLFQNNQTATVRLVKTNTI